MALYTSFGLLDVDVDFLKKDSQSHSYYDGRVRGNQFDMGGLLKQNTIGVSDFSFVVKERVFNSINLIQNSVVFFSFSFQDIKLDTIAVNLDAKNGQILALLTSVIVKQKYSGG
ncbi:MAG: hypothetical protein CM15mP83_8380 [Flavobacteriaceae bacterium]|nr:MAG: hypothetical protein CM15mP83_8380 [Flavobacteriaceae bacterium]